MKPMSDMKHLAKLALLSGALALAAGPAGALDVYLAAKAYLKTLPDGSAVPMWGYVLDADGDANGVGDCWEALDADRLTCIDTLPMPSLPGPRLTVPPSDANLTIHLSNGLLEPTSIVIPGQALPAGSAATFIEPSDPTVVAATGLRTTLTQRVRSYGNEAPANGGTQSYSWTLARSGTFLYHSGTWPQKQVYMGLYGAMTRDFATAEVYDGVPYTNEVMLFYSDLDPVLNNAIASGTYTTSIDYHAQWFLVNGEPYVAGVTADLPAGAPGESTLLRLLSTASETHVPTLQGLYMRIQGEDGYRYGWQDTATATSGLSPREQFTAMLPSLKTKDALLTLPATEGRFAVYDGNGYMTNPSDPTDYTVSDTLGGMLRFLSVTATGGGNTPPVANDDAYTVTQDTPLAVPAPGVLANDSDADGDALTASLVTGPSNGGLILNPDGSFDYTPNAGFFGTDSFTYVANDAQADSNVATVTITVIQADTKHVGDLDGSAIRTTNLWRATVTITVHDQTHLPIEGAVVTGTWVPTSANTTCTTGATGQCQIVSDNYRTRLVASATFTVTSLSGAGGTYVAADNHDPDGDSDGTSITILRP